MNRLIVITGCSGGGKSTLITELESQGYYTVPEPGRAIVKEQLVIGGDLTPWQRPIDFCAAIIKRSVADYHAMNDILSSQNDHYCFFDRCFLDAISYFQTLARPDAHQYDDLSSTLRFNPLVFMIPPWPEIYCQDTERKHTLSEAMVEYRRLIAFYPNQGYQVLEVPKVSVKERAAFIVAKIKALENGP
ncbi:MAG TPA: AAA family ATPase [Gammaproteobacteria bacterium]|nr:AAA family ATPase [Gammaproteobacteria bacterium]